MKKFFYLAVIMVCLSQAGFSQKLRLNAYANYVFDDHVDSYYSSTSYFEGKVNGGLQWGAGLEFRLHDNYGIELMYLRQDTKAPVSYYDMGIGGAKTANLDLGINYIMIGGVRSAKLPSNRVEPFGGLMLGMAIIDGSNPNTGFSDNITKFAWGARLGINIWSNGPVGLKLQTQLLSVTQGAGGGLYFGTGGAGVGVSTYSSILQFGLGGGLIFKFGGLVK